VSEGNDFWMARLSEVLAKAAAAPSQRSRDAYLELALHYCSMHELVHGGMLAAKRASDPRPPVRPDFRDFGSVHDLLAA
jgi:hypothetical protein